MKMLSNIFGTHKPHWYQVFESEKVALEKVPLYSAVTVQIESMKICLARTDKGWYAVSDTCPHLGASLSKGKCNKFNEIVCPWHHHRFDLKLGHETSGAGTGTGVHCYPVEIRGTGLYIGI